MNNSPYDWSHEESSAYFDTFNALDPAMLDMLAHGMTLLTNEPDINVLLNKKTNTYMVQSMAGVDKRNEHYAYVEETSDAVYDLAQNVLTYARMRFPEEAHTLPNPESVNDIPEICSFADASFRCFEITDSLSVGIQVVSLEIPASSNILRAIGMSFKQFERDLTTETSLLIYEMNNETPVRRVTRELIPHGPMPTTTHENLEGTNFDDLIKFTALTAKAIIPTFKDVENLTEALALLYEEFNT